MTDDELVMLIEATSEAIMQQIEPRLVAIETRIVEMQTEMAHVRRLAEDAMRLAAPKSMAGQRWEPPTTRAERRGLEEHGQETFGYPKDERSQADIEKEQQHASAMEIIERIKRREFGK